MVVAIDGPACAGKSTLAVMVANELNIHSLNTGMIFRAIAYYLDKNNVSEQETDKIHQLLTSCKIDVEFVGKDQVVYVDGENTLKYVSLPHISAKASSFSQIPEIREIVKKIQHQFAQKYDLVIEGRDIGTEVFPNAEHKFFVTASIESRAQRRYATLIENGEKITLEKVKEGLIARDYNDTHRQISPLKQADDAILVDTSNDTIDQSLQKIIKFIKEK